MDKTVIGDWGEPRNLGRPVNSDANEYYPTVAANGTPTRSTIDKPKSKGWTLGELSNAYHGPGNGLGDIYYIDVSALKLER